MGKNYVYIGNWRAEKLTGAGLRDLEEEMKQHGIAICEYDAQTGKITRKKNDFEKLYVGAAHIDEKRGILYCTDERTDYPGLRAGGGGQICAFKIDPETGDLALLNALPSCGANPSFCVTDADSKYLLVTNYGFRTTITQTEQDAFGKIVIKVLHDESSVVLFPLNEDGSIAEPIDIFRLTGEGPDVAFQLSPHAHSIRKAPGKNLYAVCDKGGDQVFMFKIDYENGKIVQCEGSPYKRTPRSAPRYCYFHPTLPYLYVNKEGDTIISVFRYDDDGRLYHVETVSALPEHIPSPEGFLCQSDILVTPDGKYVYDMIRHANVISVYEIDQETGKLKMIQAVENTYDGARAFRIAPDGKYLIVDYLGGHKVVTYPLAEDGKILPEVSSIVQPTPATVSFYEA